MIILSSMRRLQFLLLAFQLLLVFHPSPTIFVGATDITCGVDTPNHPDQPPADLLIGFPILNDLNDGCVFCVNLSVLNAGGCSWTCPGNVGTNCYSVDTDDDPKPECSNVYCGSTSAPTGAPTNDAIAPYNLRCPEDHTILSAFKEADLNNGGVQVNRTNVIGDEGLGECILCARDNCAAIINCTDTDTSEPDNAVRCVDNSNNNCLATVCPVRVPTPAPNPEPADCQGDRCCPEGYEFPSGGDLDGFGPDTYIKDFDIDPRGVAANLDGNSGCIFCRKKNYSPDANCPNSDLWCGTASVTGKSWKWCEFRGDSASDDECYRTECPVSTPAPTGSPSANPSYELSCDEASGLCCNRGYRLPTPDSDLKDYATAPVNGDNCIWCQRIECPGGSGYECETSNGIRTCNSTNPDCSETICGGEPSSSPSRSPSYGPSSVDDNDGDGGDGPKPSTQPSSKPSSKPSVFPSSAPSTSYAPSYAPTPVVTGTLPMTKTPTPMPSVAPSTGPTSDDGDGGGGDGDGGNGPDFIGGQPTLKPSTIEATRLCRCTEHTTRRK